ncbi:MAG: hypothetical protein IJH84_07615 [Saccharopolyspora sp.]|uniref:hypothetical protein n=1 Tax=Saccharopolyspora TaxID=1835 RepID=UPI00190D86C1|nr:MULTISPECIES: hypothetical protein [unclassified Saccharopolyspora]MBK0869847.1 hypothetical protein [Saccharopolyspora sp. HNM0986]MBQ6640888.1 hypothetical protein [Saccharopolyspora sp.]
MTKGRFTVAPCDCAELDAPPDPLRADVEVWVPVRPLPDWLRADGDEVWVRERPLPVVCPRVRVLEALELDVREAPELDVPVRRPCVPLRDVLRLGAERPPELAAVVMSPPERRCR